MALPSTKVEVAFNAGFTTAAGSRTWTDVSAYVLGQLPVSITRGRQDEVSQAPPSKLMLTLNNKDGRFTPEKTAGAYYPNVKLGRPIRVTVTYNAVSYVRFMGFVDDWGPGWPDGTDSDAIARVTATSRLSRLGRDAELRSEVEEETARRAVAALYLLDEPAGATALADSSGNQADPMVQAGSGTSVVLNENEAAFAAGKYLALDSVSLSAPLTVMFKFRTSTATSGLFRLGALNADIAAGQLQVYSGNFLQSGPAFTPDGVDHVLAIKLSSATSYTVYLDGAIVAGPSVFSPSYGGSGFFWLGTGAQGSPNFTGAASKAALFATALTDADVLDISSAMLTGISELSGARIARYAAYAGVPSGEVTVDTGLATIGHVDTAGAAPVDLMRKVEKTENGVLYDAKDGVLTFKDRDARYNAAAAFTLNATSQEIEADLEPKFDDQFLFNDVSAVANGVPAGRVVDATSTAENGYYRDTFDTVTDSITDALAGAQWKVGLGKDPRSRYGQVTVDVVNSSTAQAAAVMGAEIGTRFDLAGLPSQAPAATAELFAEGYEENITSAAHTVKFNTSPTYGYTGSGTNGVWQLGVAGRSELGDTTRLAY